jgi:Protein of unknown function (DUF3667)
VWGLISHFAYDITHFDGKFFSTVKLLLTKPGYLSKEYIKGRRAGYLHPIRMYVFTSAIFFIIFFSLFNASNLMKAEVGKEVQLAQLTEASSSLQDELLHTTNSVTKEAMKRSIIKFDRHAALLKQEIEDKRIKDSIAIVQSAANTKEVLDSLGKAIPVVKSKLKKRKWNVDSSGNNEWDIADGTRVTLQKSKYRSAMAYDSVQKELPVDKRDNWLRRLTVHRLITLNEKWKNDKREAVTLFLEKFMHTLPQVLFISLPAFALLLLTLYARRKFYYVDHGIFTIHFYCASFILLLIYFGIDKIETATGWGWLTIFKVITFIGIYFYLYKAMRKFYGQGRFKTILKYLILLVLAFILFMVLTVVFFLLSLAQYS